MPVARGLRIGSSTVSSVQLVEPPDTSTPEWTQAKAKEGGYSVGDRVVVGEQEFESLIDGNIWAPTAYPPGWSAVE